MKALQSVNKNNRFIILGVSRFFPLEFLLICDFQWLSAVTTLKKECNWLFKRPMRTLQFVNKNTGSTTLEVSLISDIKFSMKSQLISLGGKTKYWFSSLEYFYFFSWICEEQLIILGRNRKCCISMAGMLQLSADSSLWSIQIFSLKVSLISGFANSFLNFNRAMINCKNSAPTFDILVSQLRSSRPSRIDVNSTLLILEKLNFPWMGINFVIINKLRLKVCIL